MRRLLLILAILLTLAFPAWATNYYVDSSATIAISGSTGTAVAGDWLMQATTNAKCRYMSGTGPITVSAITPGQPTSTSNQNPSTTGVWTDISPTYTFAITAPSSTVAAQTVYTNNSQSFYVNTAIGSGTSLVTTGTGAPAASGTLYKQYVFAITSASASAGATYTSNGATFTVITAISSATTLMTYGTGPPSASGTLTYVSGSPSGNITFSSNSSGTGPSAIAFSTSTCSQGATFTPSGAPVYNGMDSGAGTSSDSPWQTLTYAPLHATYTGGNSLLMMCGDTFIDMLGLAGGGTSLASPFTVGNYGTGANPQMYGAIPKFSSDWIQAYIFTITGPGQTVAAGSQFTNNGQTFTVQIAVTSAGTTLVASGTGAPSSTGTLTGTPNITFSAASAEAYYCYLTGYAASHNIASGGMGNSVSVVYDLDGDYLAYVSTLASLAGSPGWYYSTAQSALYINLTGLSPAAPGGTNPITSSNIIWPTVYAWGVLTNYINGNWGPNLPSGGMSGGIYPQISYINLSNFDLFYYQMAVYLGDFTPQYCSSYCNVYNVNPWYSYWNGIGSMGTYNNVYSCTTHHCKTDRGSNGGCNAFSLWGQGSNFPATAYDYFFDCVFADSVNNTSTVLGTSTEVGSTGSVTNCGWINQIITGNCLNVIQFDGHGTGASLMTVQDLSITGQTTYIMCSGETAVPVNGLIIDGLYCPTSPSGIYLVFPSCTGGTNIIRRAFIIGLNATVVLDVSALPSGASFSAYSNTLLGSGKSNSYAIQVINSSGSTISVCSNVGVAWAYFFKHSTDVACTFKNNITYQCGHVLYPPGYTNLTSDYNYGYDLATDWAYCSSTHYWLGASSTSTATTSGWYYTTNAAGHPQDYHSFQSTTTASPPGFANASGNLNQPTDFMLKWGAQAMYQNWLCFLSGASGKPSGVAGIDRDYFGTAMPSGGGMQDVGAFQVNRGGGAN